MTSDERVELQKLAQFLETDWAVMSGLLIAILLPLISLSCLLTAQRFHAGFETQVWAVSAGALSGLLLALAMTAKRFMDMRRERNLCREDLAANRIQTIRGTLESAAEIRRGVFHLDTRYRAMFLGIGDGKLFFLDYDPQQIPLLSDQPLGREFQIMRAPLSGRILSLVFSGEPVTPLPPIQLDLKVHSLPESCNVIAGDLETLQDHLR